MVNSALSEPDSFATLKKVLKRLEAICDGGKPWSKRARIFRQAATSAQSTSMQTKQATMLNTALCDVLLARDKVAAAAKKSEFTDITLQELDIIDERIYKAGVEVYLRQPTNLAAWRDYRNLYVIQAETDHEDRELGWWWYIDEERGHQLRRTLFWGLYFWRTVIGLFVLGLLGIGVINVLGDTLPRVIRFFDTFLDSQNISILSVFNENTIAVITLAVTQVLVFGRIASWAARRTTYLFNLGLAYGADWLVARTNQSIWWRARIVSLFRVSALFTNILLFFVIMIVANTFITPRLDDWNANTQAAVCMSVNDAEFVAQILLSDQSLMLLTRAGRCAQVVGLVDDARYAYQRVLQKDPACPTALYLLGDMYLTEGNLAQALPLIDLGLSNTMAQLDKNGNFVASKQDNPDMCPPPQTLEEVMGYEYLFRVLQIRALIDQGFYPSALVAGDDLWQEIVKYDQNVPDFFYNLEQLDPPNNKEEGILPTVEISYYSALTRELLFKTEAVDKWERDQTDKHWRFVKLLARDGRISADSRLLLWFQDANCFTRTPDETDFCRARKKQLLEPGESPDHNPAEAGK